MSTQTAAAASPTGAIGGAPRRRAGKRTPRTGAVPSKTTGAVILIIAAIVFALPLFGLALFTFRKVGSQTEFTVAHYKAIFDPSQEYSYDGLFSGIGYSLLLCAVTVAIILVLLLPVMILAELRYRRVRQILEFVCLLPITIPTVVLVVGFIPVYQVLSRLNGGSVGWTMALAIGVIVLPYAYRPIQANLSALDLTTLSEASRSLGAGWGATLWRVILPNLRRGIISACLLTIAVVLGEFTIASFLSQNTFQTALYLLQHTDPYVAAIFSLAALLFVFILLALIGSIGSFRRTRKA